jgi:hypothetical protein
MNRLRPLLLLDIDGVLNPYAATACPSGFREEMLFEGEGEEPIRVCAEHGAWIEELIPVFDVVWASGWSDDAQVLATVLSLPRFPCVTLPSVPFDPIEKLPSVAAHVGSRPAAWVDDVLTDAAYEWAANRGAPTLLVEPDPAVGLLRQHVDELMDWASVVAPPADS